VIHAYALDPQLVASWGRREEFRFVHDKFGFGTPRAMLELPDFSKWKRAVYAAATELNLSQEDLKRIEELFRLLGENKSRRADRVYDGLRSWLENAVGEYERRPFAAILAVANPSGLGAVLVSDQLRSTEPRWACATGFTCARTPAALASTLSAMLVNCGVLHLVDPHFGPENSRHRRVLEALVGVLVDNHVAPEVIRVHCMAKSTLDFFQGEAKSMASRLPAGITVEFNRWRQRTGGDLLHNRYVLTDLGGVTLGVGLDVGQEGETDDLLLLPRDQHVRRWEQYAGNDGSFELVDAPLAVQGTKGR
jgi:hypothetical protein